MAHKVESGHGEYKHLRIIKTPEEERQDSFNLLMSKQENRYPNCIGKRMYDDCPKQIINNEIPKECLKCPQNKK